MSTAAFLLPLTAAADSRVQSASPGAAVSAAAHLDFKIVIPQVLYLRVADADDRVLGLGTVAVMSNGRTVSLNATAPAPAIAAARATATDQNSRVRGNVILNAAARRGIAQDAQCKLGGGPRPLVCTVSMP